MKADSQVSRERGERLKRARDLTGLSRNELAIKYPMHVNKNTLAAWEDGRHNPLSKKGAVIMVEVLNGEGIDCTFDWLYDLSGTPPSFDFIEPEQVSLKSKEYTLQRRSKKRAERLKIVRGMTTLSTRQIAEKYPYLNAITFRGWEACRHGGLTKKGATKVIKMLEQEGISCKIEWLLYGEGSGPAIDAAFNQNIVKDIKIDIESDKRFFEPLTLYEIASRYAHNHDDLNAVKLAVSQLIEEGKWELSGYSKSEKVQRGVLITFPIETYKRKNLS